MPEEIPANFEEEIAEISAAIERRRDVLERESGIIEEPERKAAAKEAIAAHIQGTQGTDQNSQQVQTQKLAEGESYLDTLDEESTGKVVALVDEIREKGIKKAITEAREKDPYVLDAFHDALVDKLYDELVERGYI